MTYFERQLDKKNLRVILQKEENHNDLRYALILNKDNDGVVFGYDGGGEYSMALISDSKIVQYTDEEYEEEMGWDENIDEWALQTGKEASVIHEIADMLDILGESLDGGLITLNDQYAALLPKGKGLYFGDIEPIDFACTTW